MVCALEELSMDEKGHETRSYASVRGMARAWTGWFVNLKDEVMNHWNIFTEEKGAWAWSRKMSRRWPGWRRGSGVWWRETIWAEAIVYSKAWNYERTSTLCVVQSLHFPDRPEKVFEPGQLSLEMLPLAAGSRCGKVSWAEERLERSQSAGYRVWERDEVGLNWTSNLIMGRRGRLVTNQVWKENQREELGD